MAGIKISNLPTVTPLTTDLVVIDRPTTGPGAPVTGKATLADVQSVIGGGGGGGNEYWESTTTGEIFATGSLAAITGSLWAQFLSASNGAEITGSFVHGYTDIVASGDYSHAEGTSSTASGDYSHAEGSNTTSSGLYSHAEGSGTSAVGQGAHAEGVAGSATGNYSHSEGDTTTASGVSSHAEGQNTSASNDAAHAEGNGTTAAGLYSHAEGNGTLALGQNSHAEGSSTFASGVSSHAEGLGTTATGIASHAEGQNTTASGDGSHAEGYGAVASQQYAHAEGSGTTASGVHSHAEGQGTVASSDAAHAEGRYTEAVGTFSHAGGQYTIASGSGQTVIGAYNKRDNTTSLFVIGDGTGDDNANRHDIFRVNPGVNPGEGRAEVTGTLVATFGLSGSLTQLSDGSSYLTAGSGIVITSQSNGPVNIGSTIWEWNGLDVSQFDEANPVYGPSQSGSITFGTGSLDVNKVSNSIDITANWAGSGGAIAFRVATSEGLELPQRFRLRLGLGAIPSGIRIGFMFYDPSTWSAANLLGGGLSFYSTASAIYLLSARGAVAGPTFAPFNLTGNTVGFASQFSDDYGETLCEWDCVVVPGSGGSKPGIMLNGQTLGSNGATSNASVTIDRGMFIGNGGYNDTPNAIFNNASLTGLAIVAVSMTTGDFTAKITRLQILKAI